MSDPTSSVTMVISRSYHQHSSRYIYQGHRAVHRRTWLLCCIGTPPIYSRKYWYHIRRCGYENLPFLIHLLQRMDLAQDVATQESVKTTKRISKADLSYSISVRNKQNYGKVPTDSCYLSELLRRTFFSCAQRRTAAVAWRSKRGWRSQVHPRTRMSRRMASTGSPTPVADNFMTNILLKIRWLPSTDQWPWQCRFIH